MLAPCCMAAIIALAMCISSFAQQAAPQKIRILCLARPFPVMIAESRGILAKYGIEAEYLVRPSSESLRSDLAAGKGDVAFLAVDNDVAMVDSAGVDVVIVMGAENSENEIIAQPGTKSIADLRGRTLLVDATNTAYALELKKVLLNNGMHPGKEYQLKPVGSTPFRLQAMRETAGIHRRGHKSSFLDYRQAGRNGQPRLDAQAAGARTWIGARLRCAHGRAAIPIFWSDILRHTSRGSACSWRLPTGSRLSSWS